MKKSEEDSRSLLSTLSLVMWVQKLATRLVQERQDQEAEEEEQDPLMAQLIKLLSVQTSFHMAMVDRVAVGLTTNTLRRRDAVLSQCDGSIPQDQILELRLADVTTDKLFAGKARDVGDTLQEIREKRVVGDSLKAVADATRKQTAALTRAAAPSSTQGPRRSLFAQRPKSSAKSSNKKGKQSFRPSSAPASTSRTAAAGHSQSQRQTSSKTQGTRLKSTVRAVSKSAPRSRRQ